ncbi:MAG TPA: GNAT family N-acyltransferase [Methylophilaceae bacterium]|nr:GNAT family N-acyltransferase [Methylophilaceae bacterium]
MLDQRVVNELQQEPSALYSSMARTSADVMEAQRLRYKIFAEEMGAKLSGHDGLDRDGFDPFCDHLLVREREYGKVVGTYRILSPAMANEVGGYYSSGEFDLNRIEHLFDHTVEVGRACVHRNYRSGSAIALLWAALARYMQTNRYDTLIGCASISMADGGHLAASLYNRLKHEYLSPPEYRVFPRCPLPLDALRSDIEDAPCPALVKGYLRLGAWVCGEPAWDPDFNTADLLVMLPMSRINRRYAAHFLK